MAGQRCVPRRFSRVAMEGYLRAELELVQRRLKRDYSVTVNLADPWAQALDMVGVAPQQLLLMGQWITLKSMLDDIVDNHIRQ